MLCCSQVEVRAHRVVLAARCEYFRGMFRSGMAEARGEGDSGIRSGGGGGGVRIEVPDTCAAAFKAMIRYIYTNEVRRWRAPCAHIEQWCCDAVLNIGLHACMKTLRRNHCMAV